MDIDASKSKSLEMLDKFKDCKTVKEIMDRAAVLEEEYANTKDWKEVVITAYVKIKVLNRMGEL